MASSAVFLSVFIFFAGETRFFTSFSVSRTLSFSSKTFMAVVSWRASSEIPRSALAWPAEIISAITISWTFEESFRRRMELVTAVLLLATLSAISSCFRWNSSIRRLYAIASSIGFRSSRWMFSIREISTISWSVNSFTTTGTSLSPAILAALQRRSPAMISK